MISDALIIFPKTGTDELIHLPHGFDDDHMKVDAWLSSL